MRDDIDDPDSAFNNIYLDKWSFSRSNKNPLSLK